MSLARLFRIRVLAALCAGLVVLALSGPIVAAPASSPFTPVAPGVAVAPAPGDLVESGGSIQVHLTGEAAILNGRPVTVWIDNRDVTEQVRRHKEVLSIAVPDRLPGGLHRITIKMTTLTGEPRVVNWTFQSPAPVEGPLHDRDVSVTDNAGNTLYEGDVFTVVAHAPRGGKALALVGDRFSFPLHETRPGEYVAHHTVKRSDYAMGVPVSVRITWPDGHVEGNTSNHIARIFGQMFTIRILSPASGSVQGYDIVIKGHTRPFSTVTITPSFGATNHYGYGNENASQPPRIGTVTRTLGSIETTSDAHGYFSQKFSFPLRFLNVSYSFVITAFDRSGEHAIPATLFVNMTGNRKKAKAAPSPGPASSPTVHH